MTTREGFFANWKLPEILLVLLFVAAPLYYHPNLGGEGLRLPSNAVIWLIAIVFIAVSMRQAIVSETISVPRYFIYLAAFPILITLGGFIAGVEQPLNWAFRLLFILGGLAFFFSVFQHHFSPAKIDRLLVIIALAGLFHAGIGILQITVNQALPFWLPKTTNELPSGFLQQINSQATLLVSLIVLVLYLATRPVLLRRGIWLQSLLVLMVIVAAYIIGYSGSRIGWLSLLISLPVLLVARRKQLKNNARFSTVLLLGLVIGFITPQFSGASRVLDKTAALQYGYSGSARLSIYTVSLDLLTAQPLYGHGVGSFGRVFQNAKPAFYEQHPDAIFPQEYVSHPHNELALWAVEGGLIALIGLLSVVVGTVLALVKVGGTRAFAYLAVLLPIALHTQVELPLYLSAIHWFLFLLLLSLPFSHLLRLRTNPLTIYAKKLTGFTVMALAFVFVLFLVHTMRANLDFVAFYKGKQNENPLPYAKHNPYLAESARWIDMSAILYTSMQYGLRENVEYYISWGERKLMERPDEALFSKLVDAYEYLGDKAHYCSKARQGFAIYPDAERLQQAVNFCQY